MRGIGQIEELAAQFQPLRFRQTEVAPGKEVEIHQPRRAQHVASRIAEGERRRDGKGRWIKPAIHVAFSTRETSVAKPIRAHRIDRLGCRAWYIGRVARDAGVDGLPGLRHEDAADLKTAEQGPREFRSSHAPAVPPEWKIIHYARHKAVFDVERRGRFFGVGVEGILRNYG